MSKPNKFKWTLIALIAILVALLIYYNGHYSGVRERKLKGVEGKAFVMPNNQKQNQQQTQESQHGQQTNHTN